MAAVRMCSETLTVRTRAPDGDVAGGPVTAGSLALLEGAPGCVVTWRASGRCVAIGLIRDWVHVDGPGLEFPAHVQFVEINEYVVNTDAGAEPRLALFALVDDLTLHRVCISHPAVLPLWGTAPEPNAEHRFSKAPSASRAVAFAVVNAFTGLVAFSCGSVMHASIHPALMHDDARCEVELNPPRRLGLLRSFGLGGVEARPIPLDVGVLPIQVNSPSDDSEHDVDIALVLFSDGALRLWSFDSVEPVAQFTPTGPITKGRLSITQFAKNRFTVVTYIVLSQRASFREYVVDANGPSPTFVASSVISDPQLPLIDFRITTSTLWAMWSTPDAYAVRMYPMNPDPENSPPDWIPVLTRDALTRMSASTTFDEIQFVARSSAEVKTLFDNLIFKQSNIDVSAIRQVLLQAFRVPTDQVLTRNDMRSAAFLYLDRAVSDAATEGQEGEDEVDIALRLWSSFADDCRIAQSRLDHPVAFAFRDPDDVPFILKPDGFSSLRDSDPAEVLLAERSPRGVLPNGLVPFVAGCNRFVSAICEASPEFLVVVDGVLSVPSSSPLSANGYILSNVDQPGQLLLKLNSILAPILSGGGGAVEKIAHMLCDLLSPRIASRSSHQVPLSKATPPPPAIIATLEQMICARSAVVRNVSLALLYAVETGQFDIGMMPSSMQTLFRAMSIMRYVAHQQGTIPGFHSLLPALSPTGAASMASPLLTLLLVYPPGWSLPNRPDDGMPSLTECAHLALEHVFAPRYGTTSAATASIERDLVCTLGIAKVLARTRQFLSLSEFCTLCQSTFVSHFERTAFSYFRGLCALQSGQYLKAHTLLLTTAAAFDDSSLADEFVRHYISEEVGSPIIVSAGTSSKAAYLRLLIALFESRSRVDIGLAFAHMVLAMDARDPNVQAVLDWMFESNVSLQRYTSAYAALIDDRRRSNDIAQRVDKLVRAICSSGHASMLSRLPWTGLRSHLCKTLSDLAESSPVDDPLDYHGLLFGVYILGSEFRDAASTMWRYASKLQEFRSQLETEDEIVDILRRECDAVAAAVHALRLTPPDEALIIHRFSVSPSEVDQPSTLNVIDFEDDMTDVLTSLDRCALITIADLEVYLAIRSSHLALFDQYRKADTKRTLLRNMSAEAIVSELVERGHLQAALRLAEQVSSQALLASVLTRFVDACVAMDLSEGPSSVLPPLVLENDPSSLLVDVPSLSRHSWVKRRSWEALRQCLDRYDSRDDFNLSKIAVERVLSLDQRAGVPLWLSTRFKGKSPGFAGVRSDPVWLIRRLLRSHLPGDAVKLALSCYGEPHQQLSGSGDCIPTALLQEVVRVCRMSPDLAAWADALHDKITGERGHKEHVPVIDMVPW
ncbi:Nucleoporin Nup133/Nup155-like N-terminal domain-containing protein [Plasmodiophora brassicae]